MHDSFALPGELTIFTAAETRDALLAWLGQVAPDAPLVIDAEQVLDVDGAGVQLLCSAAALLDRQGRHWSIAQPTHLLMSACATLGLADWLKSAAAPAVDPQDPAMLAAEAT
jgi:anti-anti-sigma regulatory factor